MKQKLLSLLTLLVVAISASWADTTYEYYRDMNSGNSGATINTSNFFSGTSYSTSPYNSVTSYSFTNAANVTISSNKLVKFNSSGKIEFTTETSSANVTIIAVSKSSSDSGKNNVQLDDEVGTNGPSAQYAEWTETFTGIGAGKHTLKTGGQEFGVIYVKVVETGSVVTKYDATFNNGGHGTAPAGVNAAFVTLPTIGENWWTNTGWIADKDVTVDDETITAGTTIACGKAAYMSANTAFTAQWAASSYPYVEGVVFPTYPETALDLTTQTIYTPSDGYVVVYPYADVYNVTANRFWMSWNGGNQATGMKWKAPTGSVFKGASSGQNIMALQMQTRTIALKFTGTTEFQALMQSRKDGYNVHVKLVDIATPAVVDTKDCGYISGDNPQLTAENNIATFSDLDASKTYVALFYGFDDGTNGVVYEVAFKAPTERISIPEEGVATYVTTNALDFSTQNGAFKAYVVTGLNATKTSAQTAEVTQVPAGTALLLKGAEGSYDVEVIESAEAVDNMLLASDGTVTGADDVFAYSKSAKKFMKVASSVTIPAGKAYLQIANAGQSLDIDFDGATAVEAIAEANEADVAAPVKVVKNGQLFIGNYNVAGQQVK